MIKEKEFDKIKQVAIAKDIIAQVKAAKLFAEEQTFCDFKFIQKENIQLQAILPASCSACAVGSAFLSAVRLFNNFMVNDLRENELSLGYRFSDPLAIRLTNDAKAFSYLNGYFSQEQLLLIEHAFELGNGCIHNDDQSLIDEMENDPLFDLAKSFGYQFEDPTDRLLAIWENVIANDGSFVPGMTIASAHRE